MTSFEEHEYAPTDAGRETTVALVDDFAARWFPRSLRHLAPAVLSAFCDDHLRSVQNLPTPHPVVTAAARSAARTYFATTPLRVVSRDRSFVSTFGTSKYGQRTADSVGYQRSRRT